MGKNINSQRTNFLFYSSLASYYEESSGKILATLLQYKYFSLKYYAFSIYTRSIFKDNC